MLTCLFIVAIYASVAEWRFQFLKSKYEQDIAQHKCRLEFGSLDDLFDSGIYYSGADVRDILTKAQAEKYEKASN